MISSCCSTLLWRRLPMCPVLVCGRRRNFPSSSLGRALSSTSRGGRGNVKNDDGSSSPPSHPSSESSTSSSAAIGAPARVEDDGGYIMRRLFDIARPERALILASAGTLAVTSSITLLLPHACGHVLDAAMLEATVAAAGIVGGDDGGGNKFDPLTVSLGLFGLTGIAGLGVYARSLMLNVAGNRIVGRIRRQLYASILSQDGAFFDANKSGDLISRLASDSWHVKSAMTTEAVAGLRGIVMSAGSTSLLFYTSPTLAMVSLLSIPPVFLMARVVGRRLKERQGAVQKLHGSATDIAEEVFGGIRTVQMFNSQGMEYGRYANAITTAHDREVEVGNIKAAFDGVVHVAANGAVLLVMGYGGTLVLGGELSAGDLTGFLMYSLLMAGNVSSLSGTYAELTKSVSAASRLFEIIDRIPQIPPSAFRGTSHASSVDESGPFNPFVRGGGHRESISIKFDGIGFSYPARPDASVLGPDFTLDINAGENIAIVGGSGSGKSTISLLLTRIYNIDNGRILLDGHDIVDIDPAIVREQIGVVSQEPLLFSGTIKDNIRYGRPDASDDEIWEAARAAHVTHFTDALPHGLETQVGSRGTQLRLEGVIPCVNLILYSFLIINYLCQFISRTAVVKNNAWQSHVLCSKIPPYAFWTKPRQL
ncbi:hypothetical protein ACHAXA_001613 [Cyclostephanos tholiformis]|uniref:ABC transmembrane type-1 domain-containing protein n=1 Tax=Cyclostephanos tholiformis TaxID=382380 RepID=A0ABD3RB06_9STRA